MNNEYVVVFAGLIFIIGIIACVVTAVSDKPIKKHS